MITAIGGYLGSSLRPHLAAAAGAPEDRVLRWEARLADPGRKHRKIVQLIIDLITFCLPSIAALTSYGILIDPNPWAVAAIVLEALLTVGFAWEIVRSAEIT
ncbi:hypothetical protein ACFV3E_32230 [Streptomyces sp. NPDC059718]